MASFRWLFSAILLSSVIIFERVDCNAQAPTINIPFQIFDTDNTPPTVFLNRRKRVINQHSNRTALLFFSADIRNRQNDVDYEYRQNSNFYYLTGCNQANTALLLVPGGTTQSLSEEVFFVRNRRIASEIWTGVTLGQDEAKEFLGMQSTLEYSQLFSYLDSVLTQKDTLIIGGYPTPTVSSALMKKPINIDYFVREYLREKAPNIIVKVGEPYLNIMREIKDTSEIRLMKKAIDISCKAHEATIRAAKPGMNEYELEAVMEYTFKRLGAEDVGYPSIVGSGYNSCILHYSSNRKVTQTGDLILADCGAEYHNYTADITRTFPINGRFTQDQRTIYNIVLEAQDSGIAACVAGNDFEAPHKAAKNVIIRRLRELGIISVTNDVQYYFMHGTSHYLGLDVHDAGTRTKLRPGVVLTVEPGLYFPPGSPCDKRWWNIGIRIEDDILVTSSQPENLSGSLARKPDEIEKLMQP